MRSFRSSNAAVMAAALAPALLAGCVEARPLRLAADHPASPNAAAGPIVAPASLESYRTEAQFAAAAGNDTAPPAGDMPATDHGSMAEMNDGSMHGTDHSAMPERRAGSRRATAVAQAQPSQPTGTGKVNSVDAGAKKLNLTHQPIPALGWPSMTMDFPVAPSVDLGSVKPGSDVTFTLGKGPDGMYRIEAIKPAAGR